MTTVDSNRLIRAAKAWYDAGLCVIPASADGSKSPFGQWANYQKERPSWPVLESWLKSGQYDGFGLICGAVSGNLEMFEVEGRAAALKDGLGMAMVEHGYADLWLRVCTGYLEKTPSGGFHWLLRVESDPRRNTRLARRPATPEELAVDPDDDVKVLIETRGEGGFTIVSPSGGRTHPSGNEWTWVSGSPASIPVLTVEERDALHAIASTFDEMPAKVIVEKGEAKPRVEGDLRPGDDFNLRATWEDILCPLGWSRVGSLGETKTWRRPGKDIGISATTGRNDGDNLYVFSSSAKHFETETPYSKFHAYALLHHDEDFTAAARDLARQGYGEPRPFAEVAPVPDSVPTSPSDEVPAPPTLAETLEKRHQLRVAEELALLRARDEAKTLFLAEKAEREFREPAYARNLTEELLLPREAVRFAVAELLPMGGNALLTAQFKAGKTTFITELARSWVDRVDFLGRFAVQAERRVALFNYELSQQQYDDWLEQSGITNTDDISVLHLRGYRLPLTARKVEDWVASWLKDHDIALWVADPFARAAVGVDENSNTDVGIWLDTFDVIKERAGVREGVLPVHTGRAQQEAGQERARGATRLDDWADVRWILTKDEQGERFFRASGRDVEFDEEKLHFDSEKRRLTIGGGNREWVARRRVEDLCVEYVRLNPGSNSRTITASIGVNKNLTPTALASAVAHHRLRVVPGKGVEKLYYPPGLATSDPFDEA